MSNTFATRLKQLRICVDESQINFAEMLEIPVPSYRKYEKGEREPTLSVISKFFEHPKTKVFAQWLITGENYPNATTNNPIGDNTYTPILSEEEFEKQFVSKAKETLMFLCHLGWFKSTKTTNFETSGKLLLRDLKPMLTGSFKKAKSA
ncbi:helix-turn-helix transcriptional regulator [Pseudoalteromonas sp. JBTF-M23]|uniref:Helix-turn-helix transcriptional regulator n=1 Tax=Pseudoalteromonas caenipelagi TaxID=2726988 RepID=A0A849V9X7_9GAMM|nr:helix-turn-helix transcriptional regulator [Pseudoalteromonas caenipelagi]NOU49688.1 helix-turn-helix transcriptional regulator [Pseudoalteromonas caenipelagi]